MNKIRKIALITLTVATAILPLVTMAQVGGAPPTSFSPNLTSLGQIIINQLWIIFTIMAVVMFVISGILFLTSQGDPDKVTKARSAFLWGVAGVVVGVLAYTIIALVRGALGA